MDADYNSIGVKIYLGKDVFCEKVGNGVINSKNDEMKEKSNTKLVYTMIQILMMITNKQTKSQWMSSNCNK